MWPSVAKVGGSTFSGDSVRFWQQLTEPVKLQALQSAKTAKVCGKVPLRTTVDGTLEAHKF